MSYNKLIVIYSFVYRYMWYVYLLIKQQQQNHHHQSLCSYTHVVGRKNLCKNIVLWGCGRLRGLISYFLTDECWDSQWCRSKILVRVGRRCVGLYSNIGVVTMKSSCRRVLLWLVRLWKVIRLNKLRGVVFYFFATWQKPVCVQS